MSRLLKKRSVMFLGAGLVAYLALLSSLSPTSVAQSKGVMKSPAPPKAPAIPTLNQKVVNFARANLGHVVREVNCWALVDEALKQAGAHRPGTNGYGTYVFGRPLHAGEAWQPGDVIQFEGVKFVAKNGAWQSMPHHSAIVDHVQGSQITLIHQNAGGNGGVLRTTVDLNDRQGGTMQIFRPQPK
jgi:hypothetical protein